MRKYLLWFCIIFSLKSHAQQMSIAGTVQDTVAKTPLQYAVAMAVRIKDSTLVAFTRTNAEGKFELKGLPIDTVQVIISNPRFGDQVFYVFGSPTNNIFDFGKIIMPPKSHTLNEVVIYAFKDPVYYKGDTLIYTADSFKVKPNATVEDLLKKLPGIRVDAEGKITSQGKKVDQVLVDGDEFFGTDPTVATKNLNANTVESVQVYEKKNDNASGDGTDETLQVMNLKLKDDAKKGYFGKATGASDFQRFYEGQLLANKFKGKQKVSVFALASNTPRSSFGWGDMYKYGLDNEWSYTANEDGDSWSMNRDENSGGIPRNLKSGFYYNDKLGKNTKIGFNYSYNISQVATRTETANQYFLSDTTYKTTNVSEANQRSESHSANISIEQKIDSLTDLTFTSKLKYTPGTGSTNDVTTFLTDQDTITHQTQIINKNKGNNSDWANTLKIERRFKKKDRKLNVTYNYNITNGFSTATLQSNNNYYNTAFTTHDSIDQQKENINNSQTHSGSIAYVEPLTKKIKLEFAYDINMNISSSDRRTRDYYNGEYSLENSLFTNNFRNERMVNRVGLKFIYEIKKMRLTMGSRARQVEMSNVNVITSERKSQTINNLLPYMSYRYKFSDNKSVNFEYTTTSNQPTLTQLQPIPDNTNPNQIKLGNPDLIPTFADHFGLSFNSYKPISGKYVWANVNYYSTDHDLTNSISYDSLGRTITQTVNVNGNYTGSFYLGGGIPLFSKLIEIDPSLDGNLFRNANFINGEKNITRNNEILGSLNIIINYNDSIEFSIGGNYDYNMPYSTLNQANNKPYSEEQFSASLKWKLPFKLSIETNAAYNIYSNRTKGYNTNYVIWNASLIKTFLKNENLILSIDAQDMLNQNTNNKRTVQDNVITDTKTNIVGRYILLKLTYKFNSNKLKEDENEMY